MTIYVPAHFATDDADALARLMRDHPFATVITPAGGELHVSHLPLLHVPEGGPHGTLVGHFARANPHWQHAGDAESLVVFQGPHAYVSPSWYAAPGRMVPTWNYAAVHAHGTLVPVAGDAEARAVLAALVERFEGARAAPWRLPTPSPQHDAMVGAIVAFRLPIRRVEGKFKLSQNRSAEDRARVAQGLRDDGYAEAIATTEWMARYAGAKAAPE